MTEHRITLVSFRGRNLTRRAKNHHGKDIKSRKKLKEISFNVFVKCSMYHLQTGSRALNYFREIIQFCGSGMSQEDRVMRQAGSQYSIARILPETAAMAYFFTACRSRE
jgi:hypothetical protein